MIFGRAMASAEAGEFVAVDLDLDLRPARAYARLPESGTTVLERPETDDGSDTGTDDWYAIKGEHRWKMQCGRSGIHMAESECPHRIIVWPTENDPNLVKTMKMLLAEDGEQGKVVPYEKGLGSCVSFYEMKPS